MKYFKKTTLIILIACSAVGFMLSLPLVASAQSGLSISKSASPDPVRAGDPLTYRITVNNPGTVDALGLQVRDVLPTGVTFVRTTGCFNDPIGVPTCNLGGIAAGSFAQYTIEVTVNADTSGLLTNTASVGTDTQVTINTTVLPAEADLSISKTDVVDPVPSGGPIEYLITVTNLGPSVARDVLARDFLPPGVTFVRTTGCFNNPIGVDCNLGDIAAGGSAQYTIEVTVDPGIQGTLGNDADVSSNTPDPNPSDNSVTEFTRVLAPPDLAISKTDDVDPIKEGNTLSYTIEIVNVGASNALGVVVMDTLPAGVTFIETSGCAEDPNGVPACTIGDMTPGDLRQYTIKVKVGAGALGTITNQASVDSDTPETNTGNNRVTEDTIVNQPATDVSLFVANSEGVSAGNIPTFSRTADGNIVPTTNIQGPANANFFSPTRVAVDANFIYVGNGNATSIDVFSIKADGNEAPTRSIKGTATTLSIISGVAVDAHFIYVADGITNSIAVFPINADGNVAPIRSIVGAATTLNLPRGVAVDANFIYVANTNNRSIDVFSINADGNVAPTRTIQGFSVVGPGDVAVDAHFIYVADFGSALQQKIAIFPINADGNVTPTRSIVGAATTLNFPLGVAVDANFIYVVNQGNNSIDVFPINADGNVAPTRSIQGAATTLNIPLGVAVARNPKLNDAAVLIPIIIQILD